MRQYFILYKRGVVNNPKEFAKLKPYEHKTLYDRPQVAEAISIMRDTPYFKGIAVQLDDELFNIIAFEQEAVAPDAFEFFEEGVMYTVGPDGAPVPKHY